MSAGEYWDDEEQWDEGASGAKDSWSAASGMGERSRATLALGLVAMAPLFLAYEFGLAQDSELPRTLSERSIFRLFAQFPDWETSLRQLTLFGAVASALVLCFRRRLALLPSLLRVFIEGCVGALILGPVLAYGMRFLGGFDSQIASVVGETSLPIAARVLGGAAFEELLFRVGIFSVCFLLARRVLGFFGAGERSSRWGAELLAVVGSALGFASIHVASLSSWLGAGGETFDPAVFTWRAMAGVFLAVVFRWRGPGVAAWSHGLFNLAMLIGAGPEVLL